MAIKLHQLTKERKTVTVEYEGETVDVEYRPGAITPQMQSVASRLQLISKKQKVRDEDKKRGIVTDLTDDDETENATEMAALMSDFSDIIVALVASWDIVDEDNKKLPVNHKIVMAMPLTFLTTLFSATMEDMRPNARSAGNS